MLEVQDIFEMIKDMIRPEYLQGSELKLKENKSRYCSIVVSSEKTAYRSQSVHNLLLARGCNRRGYICFSSKYAPLFQAASIEFSPESPLSKFIMIDCFLFSPLSGKASELSKILNKIFIDLFSFPAFGCCSSYVECSDARHCVHTDLAYATACQYRANLESGRIFYGKNQNIDVGSSQK